MNDPYDDDLDIIQVSGRKNARSRIADLENSDPGETDDINLSLAFAPQNDFGNGKRLIARFGQDLMVVGNIGWFWWDGCCWEHDDDQCNVSKLAQRVGLLINDEAKALQRRPGRKSDDAVARLYGWSTQSGNQARVHGMLASAAPHLTKNVDDLDNSAFLAAAPNGTIILRSQTEFKDSDRADLITRRLGVKYREGACCPLFEKFIRRIMPDHEMRAFLQRILGYCLTGSTREHKLFLFYGTGRNGKSTLINVVRHVMKDYAASTPAATFLAKRDGNSGGEASPDLARLPGVRVVAAAEPPEGARLDESRVKEMTGGDPMTVRHLNQGFFEFRPVFKAIVSTNHRPTIRGTDHGIWSRINLVPFTVQIPDDEIDRNLEQKLIEEGEGVLQWMLTGAEDWFANGLRPPDKAVAAIADYRADEDPVGEFLKARCDVFPPDYINPVTARRIATSQKQLRDAYLDWCKQEGVDALSARLFGAKLAGRGLSRCKLNGGYTHYLGVRLNAELEDV